MVLGTGGMSLYDPYDLLGAGVDVDPDTGNIILPGGGTIDPYGTVTTGPAAPPDDPYGQPGHTYSGPVAGTGSSNLLPSNPTAPQPTGGFGQVTNPFVGTPMPDPWLAYQTNTAPAAPGSPQGGVAPVVGTGSPGTPIAGQGAYNQDPLKLDYDMTKAAADAKAAQDAAYAQYVKNLNAMAQAGGTTSSQAQAMWAAYQQQAAGIQQTMAKAQAGDPLAAQALADQGAMARAQLAANSAQTIAAGNNATTLGVAGIGAQSSAQNAYLQFVAQQQALDETKRQFDAQYGMDWVKNAILVDQFNQTLAVNQQQFAANMGFNYAQLGQQGGQFDQTMGFNYAQLGQQGSQFNQTFGLNQQGQYFDQAMQLSNLMGNPRNLAQSLIMMGYDQNQANAMMSDSPLVKALMTDPNSLDQYTSPVPWQTSVPAGAGGPNVSWNGSTGMGGGGQSPVPSGMGNGLQPGVQNGLGGQGAAAPPAPQGGVPSYPFSQLAYNPMSGAGGLADSYYDPTSGKSLSQMGYDQNQTLAYLQQMSNAGQAVPGSQTGNIAGTVGQPGNQTMQQQYQQGTGQAAPTSFTPGPGDGNLWSQSQQQTSDWWREQDAGKANRAI